LAIAARRGPCFIADLLLLFVIFLFAIRYID